MTYENSGLNLSSNVSLLRDALYHQRVRSISQAISFIVLGFSCTLPVRFPAFPRRKDWHVVRNIRNYRRGEGNKKLCALVVIDFNRDGGSQKEPNAEGRQRFPFSFPFWCPTTYVPSGRIQQALGDSLTKRP